MQGGFDLRAGLDFGGVRAQLYVRNLFDEAYVSNFGAVTDSRVASVSKAVFFPGEGRSAYLGVRMRY